MNRIDIDYLNLLRDILDNGVEKDTRAGMVKSVFGRQLRFDLKSGIPLLTTKKVFTKGAIHELLWFINRPQNSHGSMNIWYLIDNDVHIWDDDAFRWYKEWLNKHIKDRDKAWTHISYHVAVTDDEIGEKARYEWWLFNEEKKKDDGWLFEIDKDEFITLAKERIEIVLTNQKSGSRERYRFGDLGPIYGKQWRNFGISGIDQIEHIIETLKTNPNDRRMICLAFNPDALEEMALPPCHVMMQFYTRELKREERVNEYKRRYGTEPAEINDDMLLNINNIPKYGLSCMWTQRSCDFCLGIPFNLISYGVLTYMMGKLVNMVPDELIGSLGDCHIYLNQMEGVKEQLSRSGSDIIPQLKIKGNQKKIEDFKFSDFKIENYHPNPPIAYPLSVG